MRNILICLILLFYTPGSYADYQSEGAKEIQKNCSSENREQSTLSSLLETFQDKFKDVEYRNQHPAEMVRALDEIIYQSPFASILKCRDDLIFSNHIYNITFLNPSDEDQTMSVETLPRASGISMVNLGFSTKKSAQNILFVYLHELTHVCQINTLEEKLTASVNSTEGREAIADFYRYQRFQEVEAFYKMHEAYKFLTAKSPRLCMEESNLEPGEDAKLFPSYAEGFEEIDRGTFAQQIILAYHLFEDIEFQGNEKSFLFDLSSPLYTFRAAIPGESMTTHSLHPLMKKMIIDNLHIPVIDPQ